VFFAIAQIAGAFGPAIYGALIGNGTNRTGLFIGYLLGAVIMAAGGVIELIFGINAEGQSLESVTKPLSSVDKPDDATPLPSDVAGAPA
jgi:hypothetical protein